MNLIDVAQDDTMPVPGFEHHSFTCSACGDVERRLVFRQAGQTEEVAVPVRGAPSISPEMPGADQHTAARSILRVIEKLLPF
jgi:hypothetical protein